MAEPLRLHQAVRERREARMSARALAEYLILRSDEQERILHNSRWSVGPIVTANADALRALRAYHANSARPQRVLDEAKAVLRLKADDQSLKQTARDEARRCIEAIELFERAENALGIRGLRLREPTRFDEINIEGVPVSIQPDLMVDAVNNRGDRRCGAMMFRVAKAPDPAACKLDETRKRRGDHRRELARYLVAMMQMLLRHQGIPPREIDLDLCFVADIRLGERIGASSDHSARLRAIRGGCNQISRLWSTVQPKPSILRRDDLP